MTINCKRKFIDLSTPKIMGILNVTPYSFYDGGAYIDERNVLSQAEKMLNDGATFIDIGGYSTRPGADEVLEEDEKSRVALAIELIMNAFPKCLISVDTFRSSVAKLAVEKGACMVNDISGGQLDNEMLKTIAQLQVPYVMMHSKGTPKTMQTLTFYDDLFNDMIKFFSNQILKATHFQIKDIIIDPGFGFAKNTEQNYKLLNHLNLFEILKKPILCGISRKSMIYKTLGCSAKEALNGTTALNMVALQNKASILRVHDVKEAIECVKLHQQLNQS